MDFFFNNTKEAQDYLAAALPWLAHARRPHFVAVAGWRHQSTAERPMLKTKSSVPLYRENSQAG